MKQNRKTRNNSTKPKVAREEKTANQPETDYLAGREHAVKFLEVMDRWLVLVNKAGTRLHVLKRLELPDNSAVEACEILAGLELHGPPTAIFAGAAGDPNPVWICAWAEDQCKDDFAVNVDSAQHFHTIRDMVRNALLRTADNSKQRDSPEEEWLPASVAVQQAEELGLMVSVSYLGRIKDVWRVKWRQPTLPGSHDYEVEFSSLQRVLRLRKAKKRQAGRDTDEPPEGALDSEIQAAREAKKRPDN